MTANLYSRMMAATGAAPTDTTRKLIDAVSGVVTAELAARDDRLLVAETALKRARVIHRPTHHDDPGGPWCNECTHLPALRRYGPPGVPWPCPTIKALNHPNPPTRTPPKRTAQRPRLPGPLPAWQALEIGLSWLHNTVQPPNALIDHHGLRLRTTTNRTLHFVPTGTTGKALIVVNVTRLRWHRNGVELIPTDRLAPTELTDLTTLLAELGAKVTGTWNGHPTITGTLALRRPPHPTLIAAVRRYQNGCPTHPTKGVLCTCDWYTQGRAHIIQPTTKGTPNR